MKLTLFKRQQSLYSTSAVEKLIQDYLERGGEMIQMQEGTLGCGDVLLYDADGLQLTYVIREVYLNEWSSAHKIRGYKKIPAKYQAIVDAA